MNTEQQNISLTLKIKNPFTSRHDISGIMPSEINKALKATNKERDTCTKETKKLPSWRQIHIVPKKARIPLSTHNGYEATSS